MIMSAHDLPAVAWSAVTEAARRTLGLPPVAVAAGRAGRPHGGPRRHRARGDRDRPAGPAGLEARRPDRRNRALTRRREPVRTGDVRWRPPWSKRVPTRPLPASVSSGARVVVTGGARGIGAAIARSFAAQGASIAVIDRLPDECRRGRRRAVGRRRDLRSRRSGRHDRRDPAIDRPARWHRHPRQQRRRVPDHAAARHQRRRVGLDLQHQHPGDAAHDAGRGTCDDRRRARRQDRQHGEHGRQGRRRRPGALRGVEGGGHLADPGRRPPSSDRTASTSTRSVRATCSPRWVQQPAPTTWSRHGRRSRRSDGSPSHPTSPTWPCSSRPTTPTTSPARRSTSPVG